MDKTTKWLIIVAVIIGLIIVVVLIAKAAKPPIFGGAGAWDQTIDCDPNRPGYEKDGTPNPNCGKSYTGCTPGKCDPNRPGFDECGFPNINC